MSESCPCCRRRRRRARKLVRARLRRSPCASKVAVATLSHAPDTQRRRTPPRRKRHPTCVYAYLRACAGAHAPRPLVARFLTVRVNAVISRQCNRRKQHANSICVLSRHPLPRDGTNSILVLAGRFAHQTTSFSGSARKKPLDSNTIAGRKRRAIVLPNTLRQPF